LFLTKLIARPTRDSLAERSLHDRRWCSDRRVTERRLRELPVATERRNAADRRSASTRRRGLDRRGNETLRFHQCSKVIGEHRKCGQAAILRSRFGWRCFWHLDPQPERKNC